MAFYADGGHLHLAAALASALSGWTAKNVAERAFAEEAGYVFAHQ